MPLYEYQCDDCGQVFETLILNTNDIPECHHCQSRNLTRLISAHSAASGLNQSKIPGPGDTTCCGSAPGMAAGCAGPGSCCGKTF